MVKNGDAPRQAFALSRVRLAHRHGQQACGGEEYPADEDGREMDRRECGKEKQDKKRRDCSRKIKNLVLHLKQSLRVPLGESNHFKMAEIRLRRVFVAEHENEERAEPQQESKNAQLKKDG